MIFRLPHHFYSWMFLLVTVELFKANDFARQFVVLCIPTYRIILFVYFLEAYYVYIF